MIKTNLPEYAKKIAYFRKARGITQGELAYRCGITAATLSGYERGKRHPNWNTAAKLACALNCKVADLFGNSFKPKADATKKAVELKTLGKSAKPMRKLREFRKMRGFTQGELAYMVGLDITAISNYESGKRTPNINTMTKLAKALDCDISDLNEYV